MVKRRRTDLGQQEAEQETQADQVHKLGKWRRHKNFRAEVWQVSIKFQRCSLRPPFLIRIPLLLPNEWYKNKIKSTNNNDNKQLQHNLLVATQLTTCF